jgi:hypothetical protein
MRFLNTLWCGPGPSLEWENIILHASSRCRRLENAPRLGPIEVGLCSPFVLCYWEFVCALTRGTAKLTARRQCVPTQIILSSQIECQSIGNANRNSAGTLRSHRPWWALHLQGSSWDWVARRLWLEHIPWHLLAWSLDVIWSSHTYAWASLSRWGAHWFTLFSVSCSSARCHMFMLFVYYSWMKARCLTCTVGIQRGLLITLIICLSHGRRDSFLTCNSSVIIWMLRFRVSCIRLLRAQWLTVLSWRRRINYNASNTS